MVMVVNSVGYMVMHLTVCLYFLVLFTCLVIGFGVWWGCWFELSDFWLMIDG